MNKLANMNKEDLQILSQLVYSLGEAAKKFEEQYKKRDLEKFNSAKKDLIYFQEKINKFLSNL